MSLPKKQLLGNMQPPQRDFADPATFHDRIIVVEGEHFYVHSGVLVTWCEYFRIMFEGNFKEATQKEVELNDISAASFKNFLLLIHPGWFKITDDNFLELMVLADRFEAPAVMDLCQTFLAENMEKMDNISLLEYAFKFGLEDIKKNVGSFLRSNHFYGCLCHRPVTDHCEDPSHKYECRITNYSYVRQNRGRIAKLPGIYPSGYYLN